MSSTEHAPSDSSRAGLLAEEPEDVEFRARIRRFVDAHHPGPAPAGREERLRWQRDWAALLFDEGLAGPSWPRRWGGMELSLRRQLSYHEEMAAAEVPRHPSPNVLTVGPTIIRHGTTTQQERFLRPMLRGDELWAQGFSEPDAGSDLPSLRTRAVRDGDDYLVTGTKLWSSKADSSDWMFALVRTGSQRSRHRGISYLLIDLSSDGLTVRPLRDLTGSSDFSEIVLDEVRVPVANRVGEEDGGWSIARTSLGHERSVAAVARASGYRRVVAELRELATERGGADDPVLRQRLARVEAGARVLWFNSARILSTVAAGGEPGPISSVARLFHARFEQALDELAVDVLGAHGMLASDDPSAVEGGRWVWGFLRTRASTIGAGTAEIQRNTIAERVLRLPREPNPRG